MRHPAGLTCSRASDGQGPQGKGSRRNVVLSAVPCGLWESASFADFHSHHQGSLSAEKMALGFLIYLNVVIAAGAVGTVGKPERSLRRLFQAACGNPKGNSAEGFLARFPQLRQFPQRSAIVPETLTSSLSSNSEASGSNPRLRSVSSTDFA